MDSQILDDIVRELVQNKPLKGALVTFCIGVLVMCIGTLCVSANRGDLTLLPALLSISLVALALLLVVLISTYRRIMKDLP